MENIGEKLKNHMQDVSGRISEAIRPLNETTLPIVVLVLEDYANVIKNDPDFNNALYWLLKQSTGSVAVKAYCNNPESMAAFEQIKEEVMRNREENKNG
ncbi:MAG: hypothetical protein UFG06_05100 [Lachnospiraceae bacterium]|nr:hypothetical protein [Lachnospiraceae bacterium]